MLYKIGTGTENELETANIKQILTVYKHIPRRRGQCTSDAIKFSRNLHLAS